MRSSEAEFGHAFGQWHDSGQSHRWRAAHEYVDSKRLASGQRPFVMHADASMQLVVQTDFLVPGVIASGQLDSVHSQVRAARAWRVRIL